MLKKNDYMFFTVEEKKDSEALPCMVAHGLSAGYTLCTALRKKADGEADLPSAAIMRRLRGLLRCCHRALRVLLTNLEVGHPEHALQVLGEPSLAEALRLRLLLRG